MMQYQVVPQDDAIPADTVRICITLDLNPVTIMEDIETIQNRYGMVSLFAPAVLDEIAKMKQKNIAVEILKKLLAEQVSRYQRTNVVQSQKFSEIIARIMNAYYNGHISNDEVIKELLEAAEQIAKARQSGEQLGLTQEELAFYDALTKPAAIKDFYGNDQLIAMTRELTETLRKKSYHRLAAEGNRQSSYAQDGQTIAEKVQVSAGRI